MRSRLCGLAAILVLAACKDPPPPPPAPPPPAPAPTPAPSATTMTRIAPLAGFSGFSKDGKTFGYVDKSPTTGIYYAKTIGVGDDWPKQKILDDDMDAGNAALVKDGYVAVKPPPADLTLSASLTAKPPTMRLERGGKSVDVKLPAESFPPTDRGEILGVSADGKLAAIHVAGPDVPGLITTGKGGTFHFIYVAPVP